MNKFCLLLLLPLAACLPKERAGKGGIDVIELDPEITMNVTPSSQAMNLGESAEFVIDVDSEDYDGVLTFSVGNLPESWEAQFDPPTTALADGDSFASTLTVTVPSNGSAGSFELNVEVDAGDLFLTSDIEMSVEDTVLVPIAPGTAGGEHNFLSPTVRLGTTVRFENYDTIAHRIHASYGDAGFPHQPDSMLPSEGPGAVGGTHEVVLSAPGAYLFYCHAHPGAESGNGVLTGEAGPTPVGE